MKLMIKSKKEKVKLELRGSDGGVDRKTNKKIQSMQLVDSLKKH